MYAHAFIFMVNLIVGGRNPRAFFLKTISTILSKNQVTGKNWLDLMFVYCNIANLNTNAFFINNNF